MNWRPTGHPTARGAHPIWLQLDMIARRSLSAVMQTLISAGSWSAEVLAAAHLNSEELGSI